MAVGLSLANSRYAYDQLCIVVNAPAVLNTYGYVLLCTLQSFAYSNVGFQWRNHRIPSHSIRPDNISVYSRRQIWLGEDATWNFTGERRDVGIPIISL